MPIYEYACSACDHKFEVLQKMSDDPLSDCPECGRPELRKLISAAGFRLKGGGWYETDFKGDKGRRNLAESDSSGKGDSGGPEAGAKSGEGKKGATDSGGESGKKSDSSSNPSPTTTSSSSSSSTASGGTSG